MNFLQETKCHDPSTIIEDKVFVMTVSEIYLFINTKSNPTVARKYIK